MPQRLKEELDQLGINYSEAIRSYLEQLARQEKTRRLMREIEELRKSTGPVGGNLSTKQTRRDRGRALTRTRPRPAVADASIAAKRLIPEARIEAPPPAPSY